MAHSRRYRGLLSTYSFQKISKWATGEPTTPLRQFLGSTGTSCIPNIDDDDHSDDENVVQEAKSLQTSSNHKFRNILVTHFNKLWESGKLIWPSRPGKIVVG